MQTGDWSRHSYFFFILIEEEDLWVIRTYGLSIVPTAGQPLEKLAMSGVSSDYFNLKSNDVVTKWRGACLIRYITATLTSTNDDNVKINAATYWSSGTGYSAFEIVPWGDYGFCVRRTGTDCS